MTQILFQNGSGGPVRQLNAYKANLHTHSTVSTGRFSPEEIIRVYAAAGYDVVCMTDHRAVNPVSSYDSGGIRVISGVELHPAGPRGINWHILGIGVPEEFTCVFPETGQQAVDEINSSGGIAFAAHPYWCGFYSHEVMQLNGIAGIEVANTGCRYIGKEYNMQIWDEMLASGRHFSALAVDDTHKECDFFRNWTVICAGSDSTADLLTALGNGDFYSTQGPEISRISCVDGVFEAEFSAVTSAVLAGRGNCGYCGMVPDINGRNTGEEITSLKVDLKNTKLLKSNYFRLQLTDASGRMAWSNPFYL